MEDGFYVSGTPAKTFQTPTRPLSQQQFQSLRERAVKQSPSLYKHKVLSDPTKKVSVVPKNVDTSISSFAQQSVFSRNAEQKLQPESSFATGPAQRSSSEATPSFRSGNQQTLAANFNGSASTSSVLFNDWKNSQRKLKGDEQLQDLLPDEITGDKNVRNDSVISPAMEQLGNFESPALAKFTTRMVNKELEMRKLIINAVVMLIWNLVGKFLTLFFNYTGTGSRLREQMHALFLKYVIYKINPQASRSSLLFQVLSWQFLGSVFHCVILFNIAVSLWKLLIKSQNVDVSDLNLTERQKQLLGIIDGEKDESSSHASVNNSSFDTLKSSLHEEHKKRSSKTFIFKSLETPVKMREHNGQTSFINKNTNHVSFSVQPKKVNAFGTDLKNDKIMTPTISAIGRSRLQPGGRPGYIPSNRYTYMMDSPSSMKNR